MTKKNTKHTSLLIILAATTVFLVPTNMFLKIWESGSYVNGLQIDYLIGKLYLSQLCVLALLGVWLSTRASWSTLVRMWRHPFTKPLLVLWLIIGLRQYFTPEPLLSLWQWANWSTLGLLVVCLQQHKDLLKHRAVIGAAILAVLFQSLVGLGQFWLQHEILGYSLLGEPELSNPIGLATATWSGAERILPYGTTAHPNVLGGFLAIYVILLLGVLKNRLFPRLQLLTATAILIAIATLLLTTSVSALLTVMIGCIAIFFPKQSIAIHKIVPVGIMLMLVSVPMALFVTTRFTHQPSIIRRTYLQTAGLRIFVDNPLVGTGLQTSTRYVERYSPEQEVVRFTQPPHHAGILLLAETGVLGLAFVLLLFRNKDVLVGLALLTPILSLDHYVWTLWPGMLLSIVCILWAWEHE